MTKTAKVYFLDDKGEAVKYKAYHYKTLIDDLQDGDYVVVETRNGYKVVTFGGYIPESNMASAYIVQRVETEKLRTEKEKISEIKALKDKIKERAIQIQERKRFEDLAAKDETLMNLLKELEKIENSDETV